MRGIRAALVAAGSLAGLIWIGHCSAQQEIRIQLFQHRFRMWQVCQEAAVRRYLAGESDEWPLTAPPRYEDGR